MRVYLFIYSLSFPVDTMAIEEDDAFNSSDLEFEPAPRNPFYKAGLSSIQAIVESAAEDRISSKKMSKQLAFVEASKKTKYMSNLWHNRFMAFYTTTLKKR